MEVELGCRVADIGGCCVAADVHLGLEEALRSNGVSFPIRERRRVEETFEDALDRFEPETFVLNGDILHQFGNVPPGLGEKVRGVLSMLEERVDEVVLVEGGHDPMLENLVDREIRKSYRLGETLILHGDTEFPPDAGSYVIGHDHPAIEIEGEKRPCYLRGEVDGSELLVLPAFHPMSDGVTVNEMRPRDFMSPLLKRAKEVRPAVETDGEILDFPHLEDMRRFL